MAPTEALSAVAEPDTPAKRVLKLLKQYGTRVVLTESCSLGVELRLRASEQRIALLSQGAWPEAVTGVEITAKDNQADTVTLTNRGKKAADLSGWFLYSEKGRELFVFPAGTQLPAGASLTVASQSSAVAGDYLWQDTKVWNDNNADRAILYDAYGRQMSTLD